MYKYINDEQIDDKELELDFSKIPECITISTITITCKLGSIIYLENFAKYIDLSDDKIINIKCGNNLEYCRNISPTKKKNKKNKKKTNFFNQATMEIKPKGNKHINVKLFRNGSIQMTGCKNIKDAYEVIEILVTEIKNEKAIMQNGIIIDKLYVDNVDLLCISNFKIGMINSDFKVPYLINRDVLYDIILKNNIQCSYEPCIHACVNIKYKYDDAKTISIFVFQSGSIIVTGATNVLHIINAYNFITNILTVHKDKIVMKNLEKILNKSKKIDDYMKQKGLKIIGK